MDSYQRDPSLIYVIGCPGAGKGTLCSKLAALRGWAHISVGHELRRHSQDLRQEDDIVAECVRLGHLVPIVSLVEIVNHRMQALRDQGHRSFIVDGLPRHIDQISHVQDKIGVPDLVLFMDCSKEIAKERVLTRNDTSRTDNEETFERRFAEFCNNNPDIVQLFETETKLVKIDTRHATDISFYHVLVALGLA